MKIEWWYDDATFHHSGKSTVALARLTVREDGTAQILTDGETLEFENEEEAESWLTNEEYSGLETMFDEFEEKGISPDPRIKPPIAASDQELAGKMIINLEPPSNVLLTNQSPILPADTKVP
jgi:hypothetical protein